jgi:hypothetical protein
MNVKDCLKKQGVSLILNIASFALILLAFLFGIINNAADGYFKGMTSVAVILLTILCLLAVCGIVVLRQLPLKGIVAKVLSIVADVLAIAVPVVLMICFLLFVSPRVSGFAYILGSNADVKAEVQTASNMASLGIAITTIVFYLIAQIVSVVAAFFSPKEEVKPADDAVKA